MPGTALSAKLFLTPNLVIASCSFDGWRNGDRQALAKAGEGAGSGPEPRARFINPYALRPRGWHRHCTNNLGSRHLSPGALESSASNV